MIKYKIDINKLNVVELPDTEETATEGGGLVKFFIDTVKEIGEILSDALHYIANPGGIVNDFNCRTSIQSAPPVIGSKGAT